MSAISPPSISRPPLQAGQDHPKPAPPAHVISAEALEALLQSPPDLTREPKRPDGGKVRPFDMATLAQDLTDLSAQIGNTTVKHTLSAPDARSSTAFISKINTVFTQVNVEALLNSRDARAHSTTLGEIGTHLNEDLINAALSALEAEQVETYRKHVDAALFGLKYQLFNAPVEGRFDLVRRFAGRKNAALGDVESRLVGLGTQAANLFNIAREVRRVNESLQYSHPNDWDRRRNEPESVTPHAVYRYLNTRESTLEAPSEIRDFAHGRDKLDVSGIGKQLNKKLQWVNRLSGASGEMHMKYSPTHDASVLVISGNLGEPAFVAKIVGKFKESDLVA